MLEILKQIEEEIHGVLAKVKEDDIERFLAEIAPNRRIFVDGEGRSGFSAKGFAMRLMHLKYTVYFVGETITPAVEAGDVFIAVSGSGNVATYAIEKAIEFGAKPVTCSDSNGYVYDPDGIDLALVKEIKEVRRGRIKEYVEKRPNAEYHEGCRGVWTVKCDIALPCATQSELDIEGVKALVANGVMAVGEGANMPTTLDATEYLLEKGVLFAPAKAANAGGVAVSALEMSQNSERLHWTFEEVDNRLKGIMKNIYQNSKKNAEKYGMKGNLIAGANITAFLHVADTMVAQGLA